MEMINDLVSIIIPCYNAHKWIAATLQSALQPTFYVTEVVVVDDGSNDGSGDIISRHFPQVKLITTSNHGVSHARNLGIKMSRGEYLVFLDADDLLISGKIDRQVALLKSTDGDVVYGNWQRFLVDSNREISLREVVDRVMIRAPELELLGDFWCPTGAYMFRRRIVHKVGGFNLRLPVIQDARFALDCALQGGKFVHDPHLSCLYRMHTRGSVSTRSRNMFWQDCLTNAIDVRDWWEKKGMLSSERLAAVVQILDTIVRASALSYPDIFESACREVAKHIRTQFPPARSWVRMLINMLGYRRARFILAMARLQLCHLSKSFHLSKTVC